MANEMPVPPQQPIVTFFNPNRRDLGLVEIWSTERATDESIDLGTPHPNTRDYPGYRLGLQATIEGEDSWWRRVWVTDETNPDWFNYQIKYAAEGIAFPTYIRQYRIDKKIYTPLVKGIPLDSIYLLKLNTAGSGYTVGTFPEVTFSGGGGTGATGHAIVNLDGTIADVVLDDGGSGYISNPTATIDGPPIGVTATATAFVQPQTAILIAEQAEEFPQGSEFFGLYFNVTRVYETIPGPTLNTTKLDEDGKVVNVAKTKKLISAIVDEETIIAGRWCKTTHEDDTLLTAMEVVECRDIPGNPILFDKVADDERVVYGESILSDQSTIDASATEQSGSVTRVEKDAVTELVAKKVTTVKEWPPDLKFTVRVPDFIPARFRGIIPITTTEYNTPGVATLPVLGVGELERIEQEVNDLLKRISITGIANVDLPVILTDTAIDKNCVETTLVFTFDLGGQVLNDGNDPTFSNGEVTHLGAGYTLMTEIFDTLPSCWRVSQKPDEDGIVIQTRTRKNLTASITPGETVTGVSPRIWTRISKEGENGTIADEVEVTRVLPGNPVPFTRLDDDGVAVTASRTMGEASLINSNETISAGLWVRTFKKEITNLVAYQVQEARVIPGPQQEGEQTGKWGKETVFKRKVELATTTLSEGYAVKESKFDPIEGSDLVANKVTVFYPAGLYGVALDGQDYDPRLDAVIPFVNKLQPMSYGIGVNREDITPVDYEHAEVRTIDPAIVQAVLDDYVFSYPGRINVDMPDVLTRVDAVIEKSTGTAAGDETGASTLTGSGSLSQSLQASAQAKANIIAEVYPTIKQFWGSNIPCRHFHFFLANPVTLSDVTTKLNDLLSPDTVTDWPKFNPELVTLIMTGGSVSALSKASSQGSYAISGTGEASTSAGGTSYSEERGLTVRTQKISPTIHGALTVYGDVYGTESVSSTASAEAAGLGPAETQTNGPLTVVAAVTPTTIPATIGDTEWPTSGLYLYRTDPRPYRYGYIEFHCIIIDAADFPNVP